MKSDAFKSDALKSGAMKSDAMKSDSVSSLESLVQDALKAGSERDALRTAKARQDRSHAKLDKWIAAAIVELREARPAKATPVEAAGLANKPNRAALRRTVVASKPPVR